jgi:hypothetical protein
MNGPNFTTAGELLLADAADHPAAGPAPAGSAAEEEAAGEPTALALVELLLKDPAGVDRLNRRPDLQRLLFPRFLLITEASYLVFVLVLALVLNLAPESAHPRLGGLALPQAAWRNRTALGLVLAYPLGVVLAAGVCLPSFYFYSLLAGVKLTWLQITSLLGKGMASNALMLLGLLPGYVTLVLGLVVFAAPDDVLSPVLLLGLLLPFAAGLWGLRAIYLGIRDLAGVSPSRGERWCFLRRLVFSWSAVYVAVLPVMIYRLWDYFAWLALALG